MVDLVKVNTIPIMEISPKTYIKDDTSCTTTTPLNNNENKWDFMLQQLQEVEEITTDTLVGAAIYSISAVEALEQMQARIDAIDPTQPVLTKLSNSCYSCGGLLRTKDNVMICQQCGLELQRVVMSTQEDEAVTTSQNSNTNDKGFMSMKIVGKGAYGLNRNLLKSCADYPKYRKMTTLKEMKNWNSQSLNTRLPNNVIVEANEIYAAIKEHRYVFRKDVKKGVQGACLYYICHMNGISRTPMEIAKIVGIAEKFLSAGDRHLRDLNERGIISIPAKIDAINSYVTRYFELLKIPIKYKQFVLDMIQQADKDRLHVQYDSKSNTKCIGTLYMLVERIPELRKVIDKDKIERECDISKTTFQKYYAMLCKFYRRFAHVFAKHKIPLKSEWREDIYNYDTVKKLPKIIRANRVSRNIPSIDPLAALIIEELTPNVSLPRSTISRRILKKNIIPTPIRALRRYTRLVS
jgi:transcription initiation factor TFIIIB Brf1 subunit/transcription initiation factor TFIIB